MGTASDKKYPKNTPLTQRVERELQDAFAARTQWATNALEDDYFRNSMQWTREQQDALLKLGQFPMSLNKIYPATEQLKGLLTANSPRFVAVGKEGSDRKLASVFSDLMAHIWYISNGQGELKQTVDDYAVRGLGYMMAWPDIFAGEVMLGNVDSLLVFVDPAARDRLFRDAGYIMTVSQVTEQLFIMQYPQFADAIIEAKPEQKNMYPSVKLLSQNGVLLSNQTFGPDQKIYNLVDHYRKVLEPIFDVSLPSGITSRMKQEEFRGWQGKLAAVVQTPEGPQVYDPERDGELLQQMVESGKLDPVNIVPSTNGELVESHLIPVEAKIVPHVLRTLLVGDVPFFSDTMKLDRYPIVPFCNRFHRNPYPSSDVRAARPIQQYINKLHSLIQAHASNTVNQKVFVPIGSGLKKQIEEEWARVGVAVFEFDGRLGEPKTFPPPPFANEFYAHLERAEKAIEHMFGLYSFGQGDVQNAPDTFRGTMALEEFGQRRVRSKKDDIEESLNWLAGVVAQLIRDVYTEQKTLRIVGPNNLELRTTEINVPSAVDEVSRETAEKANDVTSAQYDLIMVSGSTMPVNRWARYETYKELFQMGAIDDIELLKQTEIVDVEGVLKRKSIYSQLSQQVETLTQQVKQLEGDLQSAQREGVQDRKRVELANFKVELEKMKQELTLAQRDFTRKLETSAKKDELERAAQRKKAALGKTQ